MTEKLDIFNEACRDLPEGWSVIVEMESGCATVKIVDPIGDEDDVHRYNDETVKEMIRVAIKSACERDKTWDWEEDQ